MASSNPPNFICWNNIGILFCFHFKYSYRVFCWKCFFCVLDLEYRRQKVSVQCALKFRVPNSIHILKLTGLFLRYKKTAVNGKPISITYLHRFLYFISFILLNDLSIKTHNLLWNLRDVKGGNIIKNVLL